MDPSYCSQTTAEHTRAAMLIPTTNLIENTVYAIFLLYIQGHSWSRKVQNSHQCILQRSNGIILCVVPENTQTPNRRFFGLSPPVTLDIPVYILFWLWTLPTPQEKISYDLPWYSDIFWHCILCTSKFICAHKYKTDIPAVTCLKEQFLSGQFGHRNENIGFGPIRLTLNTEKWSHYGEAIQATIRSLRCTIPSSENQLCVCLFCQFQGIILVYDITTEDSFKHIAQWLQNIQDVSTCMDNNSQGNLPLYLVAKGWISLVYKSRHKHKHRQVRTPDHKHNNICKDMLKCSDALTCLMLMLVRK